MPPRCAAAATSLLLGALEEVTTTGRRSQRRTEVTSGDFHKRSEPVKEVFVPHGGADDPAVRRAAPPPDHGRYRPVPLADVVLQAAGTVV
jgi:hypothetical protein